MSHTERKWWETATEEEKTNAQEWAAQMRAYVRGYLAWCNKIGAAYTASDPEAIGCRPFRELCILEGGAKA